MKKEELEAIFGDGGTTPDFGPIDDYLHALATERQLPDLAIGVCTLRFEEARPALRAVLTKAADGEPLSDDEQMLLFRGLYILGGTRDSEACQPLLRFLRRPNGEIDDLLGDAVTEGLTNIVTGVFDGDAEALFDTIAEPSINEFVREALIGAATFLTWDGGIPRDRMIRFLERFYEDRLAPDDDEAWIGWLDSIALLGLPELAPLVHRAWNEGHIPEGLIERSEFENDLAKAEHAPDDIELFKDLHLGYVDDVIRALEWTRSAADDPAESERTDMPFYSPTPIVNPWRHLGRNDPCPCGSGKKAKKCCFAD